MNSRKCLQFVWVIIKTWHQNWTILKSLSCSQSSLWTYVYTKRKQTTKIQSYPNGFLGKPFCGLHRVAAKIKENILFWIRFRPVYMVLRPEKCVVVGRRDSDGFFTLPNTRTNNKTNEMSKSMASLIGSQCSVNTFIQFHVSHFIRSHYLSRAVWKHH